MSGHEQGRARASIRASIDGLVSRWRLPAGSPASLLALLEQLTEDPHAPTSVQAPEDVLRDHLADSLSALALREVRLARSIADIGSGAGLPGLPLAIALPQAEVQLVESSERKCRFIERAAGFCGLRNARVVHMRAEDLGRRSPPLDLVTARAVAPLSVVAEYAAPLLRVGGALVVWRGRRSAEAELAADAAAKQLGLEVQPPVPVEPYPGAQHRHLHLMLKVSPTPSRFPRRPGMAKKRPLPDP